MKKLIGLVPFACVCIGLVLASSPEHPSRVPTAAETVRQLERELGDAIAAVDTDRLNQLLADDWEISGFSGEIYTKKCVLHDLKSGKNKLALFERGSMEVQVVGNVAAGHGSGIEKSADGKDASGEFVWMDLLEKRAGKWVFVRSAGARVSEGSGVQVSYPLI